VGPKCAKRRTAKAESIFELNVEHRSEVAGGGIDDLQHLANRNLARQSLVPLGGALSELALEIGNNLLCIG